MKRFTLLCMSLLVVIVMMAADKNGRFFLRFTGEQIPIENVVDKFSKWFSLPAETEWRVVSSNTDRSGMDRIVFCQYVGGVEVEHSQVILHVKDGIVRSANGMVMEVRRTPTKLSKQNIGKKGAPAKDAGKELLLVNTPDGYRYAHKVFYSPKMKWVYYDVETGQVIKQVSAIHNFEIPTGTTTQVTANSIYSGNVTMDVMKGDDNITYLYDEARNIHTLNAAYVKDIPHLIADGTLYDYFPQLDLPDDVSEATPEELSEWQDTVEELFGNDMLENMDKYIKDFSSYVSSPDGNFNAFRLHTISVTNVMAYDDEENLVPVDMYDEEAPGIKFYLRYGADENNISNGVIDNLELTLDELVEPLDISTIAEIVPKEGITLVVALTAPGGSGNNDDDDDDDDDDNWDDDDDYARQNITAVEDIDFDIEDENGEELIAVVSFVPDASGKFEFANERIAFSITYEPYGDPTVDIHWGMEKTLDFYKEIFNRNSFDDNGAPVYNLVYLNSNGEKTPISTDNQNAAAMANQSPYPMVYGLGGVGEITFKPIVELSVMAHEFTHLVTRQTARLEYANESGALNEAFSDIIGISVKKWVTNSTDWLVGKDISVLHSNFRDMADPGNSFDGERPAPDTYKGENWYGLDIPEDEIDQDTYVHNNSSVMNKWYFLLTDGESGTNDNGYDYNVEGIGIEKSREIAYLTLTSYATEQSDYAAICEATIEAAGALYGESGQEVNAVIDAWKAVGVLDPDYTVGIENVVSSDEYFPRRYYDLQGRQLNGIPTKSGIYIIKDDQGKSGKKVIKR